jgi:hypothetical protein
MMPQIQPSDWADGLKEKVQLIRRVGNTPDGKKLMELLTDVFEERELFDTDALKMARNLGARDVVQYLRSLLELNDA